MLDRDLATDAGIGVEIAQTATGLAAIRRPDCAAAIWQRPPTRFEHWISGLEPAQLPSARVILPAEAVSDATLQICEASGTPAGPERDLLVADVTALAQAFAEIMQTPWLRLRFGVVTTNACRKFHIDAVTARLVCTYRGRGTQYGVSTDSADPVRVLSVPTGSPILLRGTLWPVRPDAGLRHRSPPIEGTGETRSVLVLDPVDAPENEPALEVMH